MSKRDDSQEGALTKLVRMISIGSQITLLKQVQQFLIEPGHQTLDELKVWVKNEIKRLEAEKDGL